MAHHRRGRGKNRRAGCLYCKPHKSIGVGRESAPRAARRRMFPDQELNAHNAMTPEWPEHQLNEELLDIWEMTEGLLIPPEERLVSIEHLDIYGFDVIDLMRDPEPLAVGFGELLRVR